MKFLLNMNMPRSLAKRLQDKGYLCRHAGDIGLSYAEDWEIIEEARRQGEIILTHDLDYGRLLAFTRQSSPSSEVNQYTSSNRGISSERFDRYCRGSNYTHSKAAF
jgi:predicted nuclease of predicted toxin-antitoxin system